MLSLETEERISNFLLYLNTSHKQIDEKKKELNTHTQFEPYSIFSRIETAYKGHIDYIDLLNFFKDHMIYCNSEETQTIIMFYDYNNDGILTFGEFINIILADETRNIYNNKGFINAKLCFDIESLLTDILFEELKFVRTCKDLILDVRCRYDFSVNNVFKALGGFGKIITKDGLRNFFIRGKKTFSEEDIYHIILRLDIHKNGGKITYSEIEKIFSFPNQNIQYDDDNNNLNTNYLSNFLNKNPVSNNNISQSNKDFSKNNTLNQSRFDKNSSQNSFYKSNQNKNKDQRNFPVVTPYEELITNLFEVIYRTEIELEEIKKVLCLRTDFNVEDAYRLFESRPNGNDDLTEVDLLNGLNCLGIYPTNSEIKLIMKRYSLLNTNTLNYSDFFDLIVPFDKDFRNMIENREASPYQPKYNKSDFFLGATKKLIGDLFEKIIVSESKIEVIRKRITKCFALNLNDVASSIDTDKKGYLDNYNIRRFIKEKINKESTNRDCDFTFIRLDRNRDGKVDYADLINETKSLN